MKNRFVWVAGVGMFVVVCVSYFVMVSVSPCKNWYGKPDKTGYVEGDKVFSDGRLKWVEVGVCLTRVDGEQLGSLEKRKYFEAGFFDRYGILRKYRFGVGGYEYEGKDLVAVCKQEMEDSLAGKTCRLVDIETAYGDLVGKVGKVVEVQLLVEDGYWYPEVDGLNGDNQLFISELIGALSEKRKFPKPVINVDYDSSIKIWQIAYEK